LSEIISAVILGIVEGITEFLPISSTGHLIVALALLRPNFVNTLPEGTFEIFIQLGAVLAVVVYYWRDLFRQVTTVTRDVNVQRLWLAIVIAAVPAAAIGFLVRDFVKETLFNPTVVAISLIVGGVVLIIIERRRSPAPAGDQEADLSGISLRQAFLIGLVQVVALIPGVSRAASSIIGGMMVGLNRKTATQFSFYLAIPVLGGATVADLLLSLNEMQPEGFLYLGIGLVVSFIVAWLSIGWLLRYVARNNFVPFGFYRIAAGVIILVLVAAQVL
jgi:undecaprenyl-diphosphatase